MTADPILNSLQRRFRDEELALQELEGTGWNAERVTQYRLFGMTPKRIAELAGVSLFPIIIVLRRRNLI